MTEKKTRNYIVKERESGDYFQGNAVYGKELYKAHAFKFDESIGYFRTDPDSEIIFLDTEKGLELLVKERQKLLEGINRKEKELKEMREFSQKLHQSNRTMIDKYESECFRRYNEASGISPETKKEIIKEIIKEDIKQKDSKLEILFKEGTEIPIKEHSSVQKYA